MKTNSVISIDGATGDQTVTISREHAQRIDYMLKVAAEHIRENSPTSVSDYDDTYCDGYCMADDLESILIN